MDKNIFLLSIINFDYLIGDSQNCILTDDYYYRISSDQTSIIHFIEDNWSLGRIGNNSYDSKAGSRECN